MTVDHETLVMLAKSLGLFYFIAMSIAVVIYACWPGNRKRFDHAANSILEQEDRPCQ